MQLYKQIKSGIHITKNEYYGEHELEIYISAKTRQFDINSAIQNIINNDISRFSGYIKSHAIREEHYENLSQVMNLFGKSPDWKKTLFPKRETMNLIKSYNLVDNGNCTIMYCETDTFHYLFCFLTS